MHLSGEYYIDLTTASYHDMFFSLVSDSVFRVYAEPSIIDIDLWLYRINDDDSMDLIDWAITFNKEETMYLILEGGTQANPAQYRLRFRLGKFSLVN